MRTVARKKIVFVLVEGPSDDSALNLLLSRIYDKNYVYVHIMHADITTMRSVTAANIVSKVGNEIRAFAKNGHYMKKDFQEILHISDLDGAYVPEDAVVEDAAAVKPAYSVQEIRTANREGILLRNRIKSANLDRLAECGLIWDIPYRLYYMACNLDHVLYGKMNCSDKEKEENAYRFAREYREDIPGFIRFLAQAGEAAGTDYRQSWQYVREGRHSLERGTNLGICFAGEPGDGT